LFCVSSTCDIGIE